MGATIDEHGLVADEYPSIEAVAAALSEQFKVGPMATKTEDLIYYDTFDALLRESGLTCLARAGALPDPDAMGNGISEAIGVRALLPQARIRARTETAPLLDELEKTVARVGVVALTVIGPGGDHRPLPPRLWVRGVRGYDEELGAALGLLQARLPLHDAELSVHDEAVTVAGGDPAGFTSKPDIKLELGEPSDGAVARTLTALAEVIDANLPGTLADIDTEFLHDYRVSLRRTRAVLREFRRVFPAPEWRYFRGELKWLQGVTSDTRDLDVYVEGFDVLRDLVPAELRQDLEPLRAVLERRRESARRQMVDELDGERARRLAADWAGFVAGLPDRPLAGRPDAERAIEAVSGRRIRKLHARMVKMGGAIGEDSPAADYHELRKQGKELRYLLELFGAPLHDPDVVKPMVRVLKGLQDVLGRHQDREVQVQTLRRLGADLASFPGGPGALMAMGVLIERLDRDALAARGEFAASFEQFGSAEQQSLVKETFA